MPKTNDILNDGIQSVKTLGVIDLDENLPKQLNLAQVSK